MSILGYYFSHFDELFWSIARVQLDGFILCDFGINDDEFINSVDLLQWNVSINNG